MTVPECQGCGTFLAGRQRKWCSDDCRKREARRQHLRNHFNITLEQYELILAKQGGRCGICRRFPKEGKSLAVDHAHREGSAGPIRGLLCFMCNKRLLGARSDDAVIRMYDYVINPPAVDALGGEVIAPGRPRKPRKKGKKK